MAGSYALRAVAMLGQTKKAATILPSTRANIATFLLPGILDINTLPFSSFWKAYLFRKVCLTKNVFFSSCFFCKKTSFTRHIWQKHVLFDIRLLLPTRETVLALRWACDWRKVSNMYLHVFFGLWCQTTRVHSTHASIAYVCPKTTAGVYWLKREHSSNILMWWQFFL